jgi:hypothetical protein
VGASRSVGGPLGSLGLSMHAFMLAQAFFLFMQLHVAALCWAFFSGGFCCREQAPPRTAFATDRQSVQLYAPLSPVRVFRALLCPALNATNIPCYPTASFALSGG